MERPRWNPDLAGTYDRVAEPYGQKFFDELARKPFDRALLDGWAARLRGRARVCDVGCGPATSGGIWPSAAWTSLASTSRRASSRSPAG